MSAFPIDSDELAAERGDTHSLRIIYKRNGFINHKVRLAAARGGHVPVLQWLQSIDEPMTVPMYEAAALELLWVVR